jgi:hypothetical protein
MIRFYDRLLNKEWTLKELPPRLELGRVLVSRDEKQYELTQSVLNVPGYIDQNLLVDHKYLQDVFTYFKAVMEGSGELNIRPIIPKEKVSLDLNEFEEYLLKKIHHLEEIFRSPHYQLERQIEKVNVALAKKIPTRTYEYVASHTEDWHVKSLVCFQPNRILHEYLDQNFNVYENQVYMLLVTSAIRYLDERVLQVGDMKNFYENYHAMMKTDFTQIWFKKRERTLELVGPAYTDQYSQKHKVQDDQKLIASTLTNLRGLKERLQALRQNPKLTGVKASTNLMTRNTNVLVNHKHYRYLPKLCTLLIEVNNQAFSEAEKVRKQQLVIQGFQDYCRSLIVYILRDKYYLNYTLDGDYKHFSGVHKDDYYPAIDGTFTDDGVFLLNDGTKDLRIVFFASKVDYTTEKKIPPDTLIMYLKYDHTPPLPNRGMSAIGVSPTQFDCAEELSAYVRGWILTSRYNSYLQPRRFKSILLNYIDQLDIPFITFELKAFTYQYTAYPQEISPDSAQRKLESLPSYKLIKSNEEKRILREEVGELIRKLNLTSLYLRETNLRCPGCFAPLDRTEVKSLRYLVCENSDCQTILDLKDGKLKLGVKSELPEVALGMDAFEIDL